MALNNQDVLRLAGNILNNNGENNQKIVNMLLKAFNFYIRLYEDILKLNYIDDLEGTLLDRYAQIYGIAREGLDDAAFRALIKTMLWLKISGTTFNNLTSGMAFFLGIEETQINLKEPSTNNTVQSRHIASIDINAVVDMLKLLAFVINLKAAGIIIDCWSYLIKQKFFKYDISEYDTDDNYTEEYFRIDCNGNVSDVTQYSNTDYEYDRHEYNLDEMSGINDD